jgi:hypothetical protein
MGRFAKGKGIRIMKFRTNDIFKKIINYNIIIRNEAN